jgi:hypothetical protein
MANYQTIKQQIVDEYGVVVGFIKNHTYTSLIISLAVGFLLGKAL